MTLPVLPVTRIKANYKNAPPFLRQQAEETRWLSPKVPTPLKGFRDANRETKIRQEFAHFLDGYQWAYFLTFTTAKEKNQHWYRKNIESFFRSVPYRKDWADNRPRFIWMLEHGRYGGRLHGHALCQGVITLSDARDHWLRFGRYQQLRIRPNRSPSFYLTKYLLKDLSEWDIGGNW